MQEATVEGVREIEKGPRRVRRTLALSCLGDGESEADLWLLKTEDVADDEKVEEVMKNERTDSQRRRVTGGPRIISSFAASHGRAKNAPVIHPVVQPASDNSFAQDLLTPILLLTLLELKHLRLVVRISGGGLKNRLRVASSQRLSPELEAKGVDVELKVAPVVIGDELLVGSLTGNEDLHDLLNRQLEVKRKGPKRPPFVQRPQHWQVPRKRTAYKTNQLPLRAQPERAHGS